MINLKIGTNTERKDVIVSPDSTIEDILNENNISVVGCALHLNGTLIPQVDTDHTFAELGIPDGSKAMLIAVVKADSGR